MHLPQAHRPKLASDRCRNHAFSLVELLVVIVAVAVLSSILIPALRSVKSSAHLVTCTSNLKQLHAGITLYAQDNGGNLPPAYVAASETTWSSRIDEYMDRSRKNNNNVFACPDALALHTPDEDGSQATYGMNGHIPAAIARISDAQNPDTFCLLSEASWNGGGGYYNSQLWGAGGNRPLAVHETKTNVLFLDGHIELMEVNDIPYGINTPEGRAFWRGTH